MSTIRVLLVDDHPIVRAGLRALLEQAVGIEVIGETGNGEEALQLVQELTPDVLLLDMNLPGIGGVDVARELSDEGNTVSILALSAHDDRLYIESVLSTGASGYLIKGESPAAIIDAVRGVARGEQGWISRQVTSKMMAWVKDEPDHPAGLTKREIQVLQQVVTGKTNLEVGLALGISEKTVEKHLEAIFQKLKVGSRTEAAVWAVQENIAS